MADEYTVKINRRDGVVEITGSDKEWIADLIRQLEPVYSRPLPDQRDSLGDGAVEDAPREEPPATGGDGVVSTKPRARKSSAPRRVAADAEVAQALTKPVKDKLHEYKQEREANWKAHPDQAAIIATFLADELNIDEVGAGELIAVYSAMGWPPPRDPVGTLKNATTRKGYFSGRRGGKAQLTPTGEHFGRHASKESPQEKK